MKKDVVKIDPKINEVVKSSGLEVGKAIKYAEPYIPYMAQITEAAELLKTLDKNNPEHVVIAKTKVNELSKVCARLGDIKKDGKAELLILTRYHDGLFNTAEGAARITQGEFKEIVNYQENLRLEAIEKTRKERWDKIREYTEVEPFGLGEMDDSIFDNLLIGMKSTHEAKIEAERKAEEERLEKEQKAKLHQERKEKLLPYWDFVPLDKRDMDFSTLTDEEFNERLEFCKDEKAKKEAEAEAQRIENERLKKEAEEKEKAREIERKKAKQEADRIEAQRQAELKAERDKKEKLEAELKAKKLAEEKAEKERKDAELKAKQEAEKLSKAPIKVKMQNWINSFSLPEIDFENESTKEIKQKFEMFKKWSNEQVQKF